MPTPLFRTDFRHEEIWRALVDAVRRPSEDGFLADLTLIDDAHLDGVDPDALARRIAGHHAIFFVADAVSMEHPEHPILCVDLLSSQAPFRVIPAELWSVENNLSLANMDYEEFAAALGADGIFRGFS